MGIMHNYKLLKVNLKLFDGAAAGGAPTAGGEGAVQGAESALSKADVKGRSGSSRRSKSGAYDNVVFGKQDAAPAEAQTPPAAGETTAQGKGNSGVTTTSDTLEAKRAAFRELIEGEYKDQYTEMFQSAFNRRFKEVKGLEDSLAAQKPIMDMLMQRHKITDGDMSKLQAAIEKDSAYWEAAADEAGLTVEQYQRDLEKDRKIAELSAKLENQQRQRMNEKVQEKVSEWRADAANLKKIYPTFNFDAEFADPQFRGMLKAGIPVQTAYEAKYMSEIKAGTARAAAQTAGKQMAARIQNKAARPTENGTSSQSAVIVKNDVHSFTREDRREIARRAQRGEIIKL